MAIAVIVTAAGASSRMGEGVKKEYLPLPDQGRPGLTVLGAAVSAFTGFPQIASILITFPGKDPQGEAAARASLPAELLKPGVKPEIRFVPGGETRRASVHRALSSLARTGPEYVLIHDGARPWVSRELIDRIISRAIQCQAAVPLLPLTETPKEVDGSGFVKAHLKRDVLAAAQTPQAFAYPAILEAHEKAAEHEGLAGAAYTEDAEIWGEFCGPVAAVSGAVENRKITYPGDLG
jgi:2-C-methyl-D-erythritol 4-phosphate cytidylyltransferase